VLPTQLACCEWRLTAQSAIGTKPLQLACAIGWHRSSSRDDVAPNLGRLIDVLKSPRETCAERRDGEQFPGFVSNHESGITEQREPFADRRVQSATEEDSSHVIRDRIR